MPHWYVMLNRNSGNEAIDAGAYGDAASSTLPEDFCPGNEQAEWQWVAQNWHREEGGSKRVALETRSQALQHLLNDRSASDEFGQVILSECLPWSSGEDFHPYRSVD